MKKILGLAAVMVLAMSQLSFSAKSDTDAAVQRLVKVAKQRQAQQSKGKATKANNNAAVDEEIIVVPVEEVETTVVTPAAEARQQAEAARLQAKERAARAKEEARRVKPSKELRAQRRNMSDSKMMDVEIQRIKRRVDQINSNIERYHKTNEMLDQMAQRLDDIQNRMN